MWDRPRKNITRQLAEPSGFKSKTLWLPGFDCLDVLNAWNKKLLNPDGEHILVEHDPEIAKEIRRKLKGIPCNFNLYEGELHQLELTDKLDYAHLDFCGCLTRQVADWIFDEFKVCNGAEVHFTFAYALRNSNFLKDMYQMVLKVEPFRSEFRYNFCDLGRTNEIISFYCSLIRFMLNRWDYCSLQPIWYKDTIQSMVFYSCQQLSWRGPFDEFDFRSTKPMPAKTKKARSEAAKKAHQTRKLFAEAKKRSDAAIKAHETRRANAEAKKRSDAAKKAWETRRKADVA